MRPNVLITSPGPDGRFLKAFRRELRSLLPNGRVIASDAGPGRTAACQARELLETCVANDVGLVVPTTDLGLAVLARCRREFENGGVTVVVSDPPLVDMARDKRMTMSWFRERGLQTPRAINSRKDAVFPLVALSCNGNQATRVIADAAQFSALLLDDPELIFTEYLSPADFERCIVDMYYSEQGTLKYAVPRQGDVDVTAPTAIRSTIVKLHETFGRIRGARGCITMQIAVQRRTQAVYGTEITARLDTCHSYGADPSFPRRLIQDHLLGEGESVLRRSAA